MLLYRVSSWRSHKIRMRLGAEGRRPKIKIEGTEVKIASKLAFSLGLH